LSTLTDAASETAPVDVVLQLTDVARGREFLPLPYQRRAVESSIIDLQETLSRREQMYRYYVKVLVLNERLLEHVEEGLLTYYTVSQFLDFLAEQVTTCAEEELADYLRSYARRTENLTRIGTRAGENPMVYPVRKRILSRCVLAFVVLLMATIFVAVALEYGHERHPPGAAHSGTRTSG
jgi:hypothetical protein